MKQQPQHKYFAMGAEESNSKKNDSIDISRRRKIITCSSSLTFLLPIPQKIKIFIQQFFGMLT
jgi:hypothetical protein